MTIDWARQELAARCGNGSKAIEKACGRRLTIEIPARRPRVDATGGNHDVEATRSLRSWSQRRSSRSYWELHHSQDTAGHAEAIRARRTRRRRAHRKEQVRRSRWLPTTGPPHQAHGRSASFNCLGAATRTPHFVQTIGCLSSETRTAVREAAPKTPENTGMYTYVDTHMCRSSSGQKTIVARATSLGSGSGRGYSERRATRQQRRARGHHRVLLRKAQRTNRAARAPATSSQGETPAADAAS